MSKMFSFDAGREDLNHPHPAIAAEAKRKGLELDAEVGRFADVEEYLCKSHSCELCNHFAAVCLAVAVGYKGQVTFLDGREPVDVDNAVLKVCGLCSVRLAESQEQAKHESLEDSWMPGVN